MGKIIHEERLKINKALEKRDESLSLITQINLLTDLQNEMQKKIDYLKIDHDLLLKKESE